MSVIRFAHGLAFALALALVACTQDGKLGSKMPWERKTIVDVAPQAPPVPLVAPKTALKGEKGEAPYTYPAKFSATIKADGSIVFPDGSPGKLVKGSVMVGGGPVATVSASGEVTGNGLKAKYHFDAGGDLVDGDGHGVRVDPDGGVRTLGGKWHYRDVLVWAPEEGGKTGEWDRAAWRSVAIVSLLLIENLLPEALREGAK